MVVEYIPYQGPVVSLKDARKAGLVRFFNGKPCRRGHIAQRYISTRMCIACIAVHQTQNRDGLRLYAAQWHASNKERRHAAHRMRYLDHKPAVLARSKAYRDLHKEDYARWGARWNAENPEARRAHWNARRARVAASAGSHTPEERASLLIAQNYKCANPRCRASIEAGYEIDHIVPLALGGANDISNIQLLCMPCNRSKGAKDPTAWALLTGALLPTKGSGRR
jgi:5-methylcytosine-specific restriction endonuclease McrA